MADESQKTQPGGPRKCYDVLTELIQDTLNEHTPGAHSLKRMFTTDVVEFALKSCEQNEYFRFEVSLTHTEALI